ncbi:unnamed protein product [Urochloa humidicola]
MAGELPGAGGRPGGSDSHGRAWAAGAQRRRHLARARADRRQRLAGARGWRPRLGTGERAVATARRAASRSLVRSAAGAAQRRRAAERASVRAGERGHILRVRDARIDLCARLELQQVDG